MNQTGPIPTPETPLPEVVDEEIRLLEVVRSALSRAVNRRQGRGYDQQLLALRDALNEEKLADDQAAILEQMDRISALSATRAKHVEGHVDPNNPYFAHMRIDYDETGRRDILLGKNTFVSEGVRIVDWRNAPISRVFYQTRQGEYFDVELAGREVSGQILARRTMTIQGGVLQRVNSPEGHYVSAEGKWFDLSTEQVLLQGGQGTAQRPDTAGPILGARSRGGRTVREDKHLPEIAAMLDGSQFDLISKPDSGIVAIQGNAGSGKTTVGLHRLAYLNFNDKQRFRPNRMMVLVFSESLARYIGHVLPALGVQGVPVRTLHHWAQEQVKHHFRNVPRLRAEDTPAAVVRFKTHRALISMLDETAPRHQGRNPVAVFDELFTDSQWIREGLMKHAPNAFTPNQCKEIHRWCADEYLRREDKRSAESNDDGSGMPLPKARYDAEDDMLLLRLQQLLRGGLKHRKHAPLQYDHILIDEAQDFSPLEILVLKETAKTRSMTLAGDTAQAINEHNDFSDWTEVLGAIGEAHVVVSPLAISYRSTREIMGVAHHVLGHLAPAAIPHAPRSGAPVEHLQFGGAGEALTFLADALGELVDREPRAGIAVVTRFADQADEAYDLLKRADLPTLHRVRDHDFSFGPGVEVTDIAHTKGLEFDYVIVLNADKDTFPDTDASRHLLHVGLTRAAHQVWLLSWRPVTPLLPPDLAAITMG